MSSDSHDETFNRDYSRVVCPYCEETNDLTESVGARGEDVTSSWCGDCGQEFGVQIHISISVTARKL